MKRAKVICGLRTSSLSLTSPPSSPLRYDGKVRSVASSVARAAPPFPPLSFNSFHSLAKRSGRGEEVSETQRGE